MGIDSAKQTIPVCTATRLIVSEKLQLVPETVTAAGAISVSTPVTYIHAGGALALTLADGLEGQRKLVVCTLCTGTGTITPVNFANGTTIAFDTLYDTWEGIFHAGNWYSIGTPTATVT